MDTIQNPMAQQPMQPVQQPAQQPYQQPAQPAQPAQPYQQPAPQPMQQSAQPYQQPMQPAQATPQHTSSRASFFARETRKAQETWAATLVDVEPAMIYVKDADGQLVLDAKGNKQQLVVNGKPQFSETRFKAVVLDPADGVERVLWVLKNQFLNSQVPTIPGIGGLPVQITSYLDDQDRPQIAKISYNIADTKVLSSDLRALLAKGAVKMEF